MDTRALWQARTVPDPVTFLGRRVSLRHRIDDEREGTTDVVGRVLEADDAHLVVERRDGSVVTVETDRVVAMRIVPDRPRRTRGARSVSAEELTRIASRGWPATTSVALGEWELRAAGGFTGRANSVAVTGDPGVPLDEALARVDAFYRAHDLPPRAQVVVGSAWEARFVEAGWGPARTGRPGAIVQTLDLPAAGLEPPQYPVDVARTADAAWLDLYERVDDRSVARAVLEAPPTVGFASVREDGRTVAVGRVVVTGTWTGLSAMQTRVEHERRGLARSVLRACLAWAVEHGASTAYLQTTPDNDPALALYASSGFETHHAYRYLEPGGVRPGLR